MSSPPSVMSSSLFAESTTRAQSEFTHEKPSASRAISKVKAELKSTDRRLRELNKRLKAIYEDAGMEYGADVTDEDTIQDRVKVATRLRASCIEDVLQTIRRARHAQLCFLVDATGSMSPHIDGVKRFIDEIMKKLTEGGPGKGELATAESLKVAFVAYRDFSAMKNLETLPFTTNTEEFKTFSAQLKTYGNTDLPEDVFGGLDEALQLGWSAEYGTKVIFHIADFPCHGNDYHDGLRDDYPSGDPKGRTREQLFTRLRALGIEYYFGKITQWTDIMIPKFSEVYGEPILEFDVENVDKIRDAVITSVSLSVMASVSKSHLPAGRKERVHFIDVAEPDWAILREKKGFFVSYEFPDSIEDIIDDEPMVRNKKKDALVKVSPNPFGKGAERIAFYGKDVSEFVVKDAGAKKTTSSGSKSKESLEVRKKDEGIVLKEYLHTGKGMNAARRYEASNQMQTIAAFLAQKFVRKLKDRAGIETTIKFLKIRTLCLDDGINTRFMSCERRFAPGTKFVRFTNNAGYHIMEARAGEKGVSMEFVRLVSAFSHWTYKASNRFLMVVDLEGVVEKIGVTGTTGVLLTDPAIHCSDPTRFGRMNLGTDGMKKFFERHECNEYCNKLGLEAFVC